MTTWNYDEVREYLVKIETLTQQRDENLDKMSYEALKSLRDEVIKRMDKMAVAAKANK